MKANNKNTRRIYIVSFILLMGLAIYNIIQSIIGKETAKDSFENYVFLHIIIISYSAYYYNKLKRNKK